MRRVSRFHPPDREVLKDITPGLLPGRQDRRDRRQRRRASRRCCGSWPASTTATPARPASPPGFTVGLLDQEPQLDPAKDVQGNVMDGVGEVAAPARAEYDDVHGQVGRPRRRLREARRASRPTSRPRSRPTGAWDLDRTIEIAMDALRLPPGDADVTTLSGGERRRVALCRLLLSAARPAAARRAHQPPRRRVGGLARADPAATTRAPSWPSPTTATSSTTSAGWILELDRGRGIPFEGNYSSWLEQKQERLRPRGEGRLGPGQDPRARARVGAHGAQGPPGQGQGPPRRPTRSCSPRPRQAEGAGRPARDRHPAGRAPRRRGDRGRRTCRRATATGC